MTRRDDSLIGQIVAANVVLVALTLLAASLAAGLDLNIDDQRWSFLILALAIILTLCVNLWMLQRRFAPLERLIKRIETIDPAEPATHQLTDSDPVWYQGLYDSTGAGPKPGTSGPGGGVGWVHYYGWSTEG